MVGLFKSAALGKKEGGEVSDGVEEDGNGDEVYGEK